MIADTKFASGHRGLGFEFCLAVLLLGGFCAAANAQDPPAAASATANPDEASAAAPERHKRDAVDRRSTAPCRGRRRDHWRDPRAGRAAERRLYARTG